jgi:hypothetical protein
MAAPVLKLDLTTEKTSTVHSSGGIASQGNTVSLESSMVVAI